MAKISIVEQNLPKSLTSFLLFLQLAATEAMVQGIEHRRCPNVFSSRVLGGRKQKLSVMIKSSVSLYYQIVTINQYRGNLNHLIIEVICHHECLQYLLTQLRKKKQNRVSISLIWSWNLQEIYSSFGAYLALARFEVEYATFSMF